MQNFNYDAPAEIFSNAGGNKRRPAVGYRRFNSGAEAVRFAVEGIPGTLLVGVILEADEERFDHLAIRALYDSPEYPLVRDDAAH